MKNDTDLAATKNSPSDLSTLAPDAPFWAIGDVHGCVDLLAPLLRDLMEGPEKIILVGDYINKGPDSAKTLDLLQEATATGQVIALRGNHEDLLLRFLRRPRQFGRSWINYGGLTTLESFGITGLTADANPAEFFEARDALTAALGPQIAWLETLPYVWHSGNVAVLHAGADPDMALEDQVQKAFAWGHPNFHSHHRKDGTWIVHGHRPVQAVRIRNRRIAIDTEAYVSGTLSAVRVSAGSVTVR